MSGESNLELDRPRSALGLLGTTFKLYRRYPLLFPTLAAAVVVPYLLVVLLITGQGPFEHRHMAFLPSQILSLSDVILVWPLVSALHVHAVQDVAGGTEPRLSNVARRGLARLPVVTAAVAITWVATTLGFFALVIPGIYLSLRWAVVAQAATLEEGGWIDALKRSAILTRDNFFHIFLLVTLSFLVVGLPSFLIGWLAFPQTDTTAVAFLVGVVVSIIQNSFGALATAVLYFDLRARLHAKEMDLMRMPSSAAPATAAGPTMEPTGHPLDPASYSDEDRPPGWYIVPNTPQQMRYWGADGTQTWGKRSAKTPKRTLAEWRETRETS